MTSSTEKDPAGLKASSKPDSTDATAVPSESSLARRTIGALLAVQPLPPGQLPIEALVMLRQLEQTDASANASTNRSTGCCFDVVNVPALWCANQVCQRCIALNQLLQAFRMDTSSAVVKDFLNTCSRATVCQSMKSNARSDGSLPTLPLELLEFVVDYAIHDMKRTRCGYTVATLMHVSSSVRLKIAKEFSPIKLYQVKAPRASRVLLPEELASIIAPTIRWSLQDIAFKRNGAEAPNPWELLSLQVVRFKKSRLKVRCVEVTARFEWEPPDQARYDFELAKQTRTYSEAKDLTLHEIGHLFVTTIKGLKEDPKQDDDHFPPRTLNLHQRALAHASFGDPHKRVTIDITIRLKHASSDPEFEWCKWKWKFLTKGRRD